MSAKQIESSQYFSRIDAESAFARVSVAVVTHPKKSGSAVVRMAYPRDGAGVVKCYIEDRIGDKPNGCECYYGTAGGYGYDKRTAAMSGGVIDGHKIYDHCAGYDTAEQKLKARGVALYKQDPKKAERFAKKHGMRFANWESGKDAEPGFYSSCYFEPGLDRLTALGYRVDWVI